MHVLGALEEKGFIRRTKSTADSRQTIVSLTPAGQGLYEATFLEHVQYMRRFFEQLSPDESETLTRLLAKLKGILAQEHP